MNEPDNRDARHLALDQVGAAGQARIRGGSALVIGVGGLGCAAAQYLAAAGTGRLHLVDFDTVDSSNLGRQVLFRPGDIGQAKADVARYRLLQQHPGIDIVATTTRLDDAALRDAARNVDVVLDASDNFATRFSVNAACLESSKPLVSGAAIRLEGQLTVFVPGRDAACYRCAYSQADENLDDCDGNGVLSPVPGVIGTMMAVECLKLLAGIGSATSSMTLYDAANNDFRRVRISRNPECPACGRDSQ